MRDVMRMLATLGLLLAMGAPSDVMAQPQHDGRKGAGKTGNAFEHVHALTIDGGGQVLYLGAHTGLFRSEDRGKTWKPVALGTKNQHLDVMAIEADPRDRRTLYVTTHEAGVFRTEDGGISWTPVNTGLGGLDVHGVALDPNGPRKLHAAVRGQGEGIYRTTDAGGK